MDVNGVKESVAVFLAGSGLELRCKLVRLTRLSAVLEVSSPDSGLRASEVLQEFRLLAREQVIYSGRAVVGKVLETGSAALCEVTLAEDAWSDLAFSAAELQSERLAAQFGEFLGEWQKLYRIEPAYKVVVADMHTFFTDLRLWLDQVQMKVRSAATGRGAERLENEVAIKVAGPVLPCIDALFERFERVAETLPLDHLPAHRNYMRRQLHGLVMCSPFAHRTFVKPLGYAGDYEMVSMIARNRPEGDSLFAKVVNTWFVRQPPAEAHRNRLKYLVDKLTSETMRVMRSGGKARILNVACGPAHEVQEFISNQPIAEHAEFSMVDFNAETLDYLRTAMNEVRHRAGRRTGVTYAKKSVYHLLKDATKSQATVTNGNGGHVRQAAGGETHDYIYCAGLFDYLSDQVCAKLVGLMYDWLAPGGLLVITNVEPRNPLRHGMEHLLDWHLIYRTAPQMLKLKPAPVSPDDVRVFTDDTGVNVFLEIRKPA